MPFTSFISGGGVAGLAWVAAVADQVAAAQASLPAKDEAEKAAKIRASEIDAEAALSGFRGINNVHTSHTTARAKNLQTEAKK